ncbi:MAG TPA: hypothetical protein PKH69_01030 [Thiobacillaceae bacterium]|nr:hypothetical protein [Thiobacillaceae bacterium]HNU63301.1 hypothetical protein [Thiobacillaceae bacterium]
MKQPSDIPHSPAGAPLTSCDLDDTCAKLDCDSVLAEFGDALGKTDAGREFLAHYCGLDALEALRTKLSSEEGEDA